MVDFDAFKEVDVQILGISVDLTLSRLPCPLFGIDIAGVTFDKG
jgi:hypothetical protein